MLVDADAFGEVLALADPDHEVPINDEMVNLGDATIDFEPEIVDDGPVRVLRVVEVDLVRGGALPASATPNFPDRALDLRSFLCIDIRGLYQRFERIDLGLFVIG